MSIGRLARQLRKILFATAQYHLQKHIYTKRFLLRTLIRRWQRILFYWRERIRVYKCLDTQHPVAGTAAAREESIPPAYGCCVRVTPIAQNKIALHSGFVFIFPLFLL